MSAIAAAVADYISRIRPEMEREFRYFRALRTDEEAVSRAALAQLPNGKRHWHQRRIPRASLKQSREHLLANLPSLREAATFDELFDLVNAPDPPDPEDRQARRARSGRRSATRCRRRKTCAPMVRSNFNRPRCDIFAP